jgi:predicted signal transduction protein with EAL and GGDEF domain
VAQRLTAIVRETDVVARLGGDEFAILLRDSHRTRENAVTISARILSAICEPFDHEGTPLQIGVSIGSAIGPEHGTLVDALIRNADAALYKVKVNGKNSFRFFDTDLAAEAEERRVLEADLREALGRNELELHYQPEVDLRTGKIVAAEALLRWHHPVRGTVRPDLFIQIAEETGLIVPIGNWVIERACREAALWPTEAVVAVNLSVAQVGKSNLVDIVTHALLRSGLPPSRLELKVTENVFLRRDATFLADLHQLNDLGVRLTLDDFGTGYSSLSYLQRLPFHKIKIDRVFVADIATDAHSAAIVCAVANLARSLDIETAAEGIETEDQARLVAAAGCKLGQGYLFGRPKPSAELAFHDDQAAQPTPMVA